jgi:hypothetical protein
LDELKRIQNAIKTNNRNFDSNSETVAIAGALKEILANKPSILMTPNEGSQLNGSSSLGSSLNGAEVELELRRSTLQLKKKELEQLNNQLG